MQDKFGRSANAVFALAASSCSDLGCESIGSDLILLGLLKLEGRCATILGELGLDCERTCSFIRATALTNLESASFSLDDRRLSADGKKVLLAARCETLLFSRDVMLEEHLLLGILREPDTVAGALIKQLNLDLDAVRRQVQRSSIENSESGQAQPTSMATTSAQHPNSPLASAVTASAVMAEKQRQVKTIHAPQAVRLETDAFSSDTVQLLASTQHLALSLGAPAVSLEHLFYAALTQNTFVKYELIACGAKVSDLTGMGVDNSSPKLKALEAAEVLRQTIGHSMEVATQWQSAQVEPEHLFLSMSELKITPNHLIHFPQLDISAFLRIILTTVQEKRDKLSAVSGKRLAYAAVETVQSADFRLNSASLEALRHAVIAAKVLGQREIGPEVLLIGLASLDGQLPEQILAPWGIDSHLLKKMCQDLLQWSPQGGESEERLEPKQNEMDSLVLNRSYIMAQKSGEQAAPEHILPMLLTLAQGHIDPLLAGFAVTSETILLKLKAANNIESQAALIGPGPKPALDRSFEPIRSQGLDEALLFKRLASSGIDILRRGSEQAAWAKCHLVDSGHLLLALIAVSSPARTLLSGLALEDKLLLAELEKGWSASTSLRSKPSGEVCVLDRDCLHIFNLAAEFANIGSTMIEPLDLLLGLLAAEAGPGYQALTALNIDPGQLYRQCYKLKSKF